MNKWYRPFGLMLLAAMVGDLSGCAQTNGWLAKKPAKKSSDEKLAKTDKKATAKAKSSKTSKDAAADKKLADAKDAKDPKTVKTVSATSQKPVDAEHEKYASADRPKAKVKTADAVASKADQEVPTNTKVVKQVKGKPKADDEDDLLMAQDEKPQTSTKKAIAKQPIVDDLEQSDDDAASTKKNVVPVKREVSKDEDDIADWADVKTPAAKPAKKTANVGESFEDELDSPLVVKAKPKSPTSKSSWSDDQSDDAFATPDSSLPNNDDMLPKSKKPPVKREVAKGAQSICPEATGELKDVLGNINQDDIESLKQGLHRIGQMRSDGVSAAPLLVKMLKHDDSFVRVHSALAMARIEITSPESIVVVTESLKSRNASLRSFGCAVLGEMGPQAKDVLQALAENLNSPDGQVRLCSAEVLIRHEDWAYPALQALLGCLKDKDDNVRWLTTYCLAELGVESPEAVQGLLKATRDPVSKVRVGAVFALGDIGPYARRVTDDLQRLRDSTNDEELQSAITKALEKINKDAS